jgi:hypothetical protein
LSPNSNKNPILEKDITPKKKFENAIDRVLNEKKMKGRLRSNL